MSCNKRKSSKNEASGQLLHFSFMRIKVQQHSYWKPSTLTVNALDAWNY